MTTTWQNFKTVAKNKCRKRRKTQRTFPEEEPETRLAKQRVPQEEKLAGVTQKVTSLNRGVGCPPDLQTEETSVGKSTFCFCTNSGG